MVKIIEGILGLLFIAFVFALIVGLIKPARVIRWSKKPTRWKVVGWWLLSWVVIIVLVMINDTFYTPEERINMAKKSIANGNYSTAITELKKIKREEVLYAEAQILFAHADSLRLVDEAQKKAIAEEKAAEKARQKAEEETKQKAIADANAAKKADEEAAEEARKKSEEEARQKAIAETKAKLEKERLEKEKNNMDWLIGTWGPITFDGGTFRDIIESISIEIEILNDHTLIEKSRTKLTQAGIRNAKNRGTYTGDITESRETRHFTIDKQRNLIVFDEAHSADLPYDKERGILDYGNGKGSEHYMKKKAR
jgi:hypothetical protein